MNATIIVTMLVENSVHVRGLLAEHGLASHVQARRHSPFVDAEDGLAVRLGCGH